ncbi:unnamed protein product [Blepharisma stoltei]|uniref:Transposase n=1 Tax=Blepharisma stoltei TaxID=1481888 RepID=A0AAU9K3S8_9CILI|nr:unnamed protein product [Blepharisma stoltei]
MLFECPRRTLEILMQEFGNDEIELEFPAKRSRLGDNEGRETKKRAIKMHVKGRSPSEISLALQVDEDKIRKWTDYYDAKKKEKKLPTKEEAPINLSSVKSDPEIEKRMKIEDMVRIVPETVNLEDCQEIDPFDLMLQDSKE